MKKKNKFILVVLALLVISTSIFMVGCSEKESEVQSEIVTVTFHSNLSYVYHDGSDTIYERVETEKGRYITFPQNPPSVTGSLVFLGWYTEPGCNPNASFNPNQPINTNLDLYAKWERIR